eukprot:11779734-Alexandrium_andersonii.AAC.1
MLRASSPAPGMSHPPLSCPLQGRLPQSVRPSSQRNGARRRSSCRQSRGPRSVASPFAVLASAL